jgi:hypothetical protein
MGNFLTVSSVVIRRGWFDRLGGFGADTAACEDWELWLRCAAERGQVRVCREGLTRYRWHANALSNNHPWMCEWRVEVVRRALATPRGRRVSPQLARQALATAWSTSAWYAAPVMPLKAVGWYLRAAWCWPWDRATYKGLVKCCLRMS